ncbi:MAG: type II secretion system protein [Candidatus Eremiobacterota bacterium]
MRHRGLSLLETVVAIGLVGLMIPFVLNLIPSGTLALKRAETLEVATAYGWKLIEEARRLPTVQGKDVDRDVKVGGTGFHVTREFFPVGDNLRDVVVTMRPSRGEPVRLATRMERLELP